MAFVALAVIAVIIGIPILLLAVRLRKGEATTEGDSFGHQLFGGPDRSWGPTPTRPNDDPEKPPRRS
jgi:hypothetical protein